MEAQTPLTPDGAIWALLLEVVKNQIVLYLTVYSDELQAEQRENIKTVVQIAVEGYTSCLTQSIADVISNDKFQQNIVDRILCLTGREHECYETQQQQG